jgi:hypothetical protein
MRLELARARASLFFFELRLEPLSCLKPQYY